MSASPSPFTGKEEKRFEVKKRIRDVGEVVGDDEEEEGRKGIKDKIRVVGGRSGGEGGQQEQICRYKLITLLALRFQLLTTGRRRTIM